jgi:type I restriction enzyme S subunit
VSFPRYPKYKPSGVKWLGEVPEGWAVKRLGYVARSGMGQTILRDMLEPEPSAEALPVYSASEGDDAFGYFLNPAIILRSGDLVVGARGSIGMTRRITTAATCTQTTIWLKPTDTSVHGDFLYWCLVGGRDGLFPFDKTAIPMLTVEQVRSGRLPFPPLPEQTAIAEFLDRETRKIDELVAEQRRLMELLKEKRQAVISHAVTQGLKPHTPMKPSGIEWVGDIPVGWEVQRVNRLIKTGTSITYGIVQAGPDYEGGIPYIRTSDMSEEAFQESGYMKTSPEIDASYSRSKVCTGDLVVAIRATLGKGLSVPAFLDGANLTQGTAKISPGDRLDSDFLFFSFNSQYCQIHIDRVAKGVTFREITLDALRRVPLILPPRKDQEAIVTYLKKALPAFDDLVADAQRAINLLQERRTALISAAVTGQINVRPTTKN